jgi:hypothetical protein
MSRFLPDSPFERLARDLERHTAQFRALSVPPWSDTLTQLARRHIDAFPNLDTLRQIEDQFHHLDLLRQPFLDQISQDFSTTALTSLASASMVTDALRALDFGPGPSLAALASDILGNARLSIDPTSPMLRAVHDTALDLMSYSDRFRLEFERSFAGQLLHELSDVEANADDDELPKHVGHLLETFLQKCASLTRDPTHAWGMFSILVTVLIFLHGLTTNQALEERINSRIDQAEQQTTRVVADAVQKMVAAVEQLRPTEPTVQYVVIRDVTLRAHPTSKARPIRVLYPNELASLLDAKGTWIEVRVFDYINGSSRTGWVPKKYLKRLESSPPRPHPNP